MTNGCLPKTYSHKQSNIMFWSWPNETDIIYGLFFREDVPTVTSTLLR